MIKLITLNLLLLTGFSYAETEHQLIPGRYETSNSSICPVNVVQNGKEMTLEVANVRGSVFYTRYCKDSGTIIHASKIKPNVYVSKTEATEPSCTIEILGPKNFVTRCGAEVFFKLYETPSFTKITTDIKKKIATLDDEGGLEYVFFQGLKGVGSCQIIACKDGSYELSKFSGRYKVCDETTESPLINYGIKEENAAFRLKTEVNLYGGCNT